MAKMKHEELVELLQDGKIDHLQFVMNSDDASGYLEWCQSHHVDPSDETAEFYVEQTAIDMMEHQNIDNEDYGYWL